MINRYNPDFVYYDDTAMPLWPASDAGLKAVAHFYNKGVKDSGGKKNNVVVFAKILNDEQKNALVWDVERGVPDDIQEKPWQIDTCLGERFYKRDIYEHNFYKPAKKVVHMLIDIVSKNGNLLLSVPQRGNGRIDEKEEKILEDIAAWMAVNGEGIFKTRPWKIFGEGPVAEAKNPIMAQGFNEHKQNDYTSKDIRFVTKGKTLYAHVLAWPEDGKVLIRSLKKGGELWKNPVRSVKLVGGKKGARLQADRGGLGGNFKQCGKAERHFTAVKNRIVKL